MLVVIGIISVVAAFTAGYYLGLSDGTKKTRQEDIDYYGAWAQAVDSDSEYLKQQEKLLDSRTYKSIHN